MEVSRRPCDITSPAGRAKTEGGKKILLHSKLRLLKVGGAGDSEEKNHTLAKS